MKPSSISPQGIARNEADVMSGFHVGYPQDLKGDQVGMVASAADVAGFVRALNDGSLFDAGEAAVYAELYEYDHTGLVPGYQSTVQYHADLDAVVVQFSTPTDFEGYNWNLASICYDRVVDILRRERLNDRYCPPYLKQAREAPYCATNTEIVTIFEANLATCSQMFATTQQSLCHARICLLDSRLHPGKSDACGFGHPAVQGVGT